MNPQAQAKAPANEARGEGGVCDAGELVEYAKATLLQREQSALHDLQSIESRKERIESLLLTSMEMVNEDNSAENIAELGRAIEAAQKARVLPSLRVQARKLLDKVSQTDTWVKHTVDELQRLTSKLQELHGQREQQGGDRTRLQKWQLKEDKAMQELRQTISKASALGVHEAVVANAQAAVRSVEKDRRSRDVAAARLKGLLLVRDAETLGDRLQKVRRHCDMSSDAAQKVVSEIHGRVERLATQEQHQQWLDTELAAAAERSDVPRLQQLVAQAKTLNLHVPPATVALLHKLDSSQTPRIKDGKEARRSSDCPTESAPSTAPERKLAEAAVTAAEDELSAERISEARAALEGAERARVPEEAMLPLQRRLAWLEQQDRQRLQAEQDVQALLYAAGRTGQRLGMLRDGRQVQLLREALHRAECLEADPEVVSAGLDLLEKSVETTEARRRAEDLLHQALARPARSEAELDQLQDAIDEGRRCGIKTLHAEREFARARDIQVHREAAEAELEEAAKGFGLQARARLDTALQTARGAGVAVEKLRAATARLAELNRHEERCALAAGDLRRALPLLQSEPWRFQKVMEGVHQLSPWTAELQALVSDAEKRLEKVLAAQGHQREAQQELQLIMQQIREGRSSGHLCADHMTELSKGIERAKLAGVGQELLSEAEKQLRSLKREGCQRMVAEHRLRLALSARDHDELERSMRQVRSLGRSGLLEAATAPPMGQSSPRSASERHEAQAPRSARLLEAAGTTLRQLGDAAARRRAAAAALQELTAGASSSLAAADWLRQAAEALREARQCGVAPALIEHAKLRVRERRRERMEEDQARAALQSSLSKKDVPTQVVLRNLRRVQRLQVAH